ncbi:uncharacterized protein LOC130802624 [Amaranthus tricolor]|uniref:uncharacterized protein LOC130802624 n=1 Tax=Amaranthus tricolor TaxID=29722 RepID=UPI00258D5C7A|nr:uncharacterized protein LOC130802624 [Amaranthus tricolor]
MQAVLPLDKWGIVLLSPFPPAKGQRKFIIVAIDYFTKYVEAEALSSITDKQVYQFIWRNIITRYGIPRVIITDNGRQFFSKNTMECCDRFNIQIRFSSVSRPQTNGQVESANKEILNGIKKKIEGDGPFKVIRVIKPETFELEDMKGKKLPRPWNGDHLKNVIIFNISEVPFSDYPAPTFTKIAACELESEKLQTFIAKSLEIKENH